MAKQKRRRNKQRSGVRSSEAPTSDEDVPGVDDADDAPSGFVGAFLAGLRDELSTPRAMASMLAILAAFVYARSFLVPFLFDDTPVVVGNPLMWLPGGALELLRQHPTRSLTYLTFLINYKLAHGGVAPMPPYDNVGEFWSYHLVSVGLHVANAVLLFWLVRALLRARRGEVAARHVDWVAFGGAAVWAVHPANTMAVAYIAQRFALMGALSFLGTVYLYTRLREALGTYAHARSASGARDGAGASAPPPPRSDWPIGLHLAVFAAAATCYVTKPNAAVIPAAIVAVELFFYRWERPGVALGFFALPALGLLVGLGLWGVDGVEARFFPATSPSGNRVEYFVTQIPVTLRYLHLQLFPHDLCAEQGFPILWSSAQGGFPKAVTTHLGGSDLGVPLVLPLAVAGHALIVALAVLLARRGHRFVPFAIGWYYLTNVVESSFIPILDPMVDHRMYLTTALLGPAIAVAVARAWPWIAAWGRPARDGVSAACLALVIALGIGTFARVEVWASATGIWEDTVEKRPDLARAYSSLGMEHLYRGRWLQAVGPIETALLLGPYHVEGWNNLGKAYLELKRWPEAERTLLQGIEVARVAPSPNTKMCWNNVGLVYLELARRTDDLALVRRYLEAASFRLREAVKLDPDYKVAYLNLANAEFELLERFSETEEQRKGHARQVVAAVDQAARVSAAQGYPLQLLTHRRRAMAQAVAGDAAGGFSYLERYLAATGEAALRGDLAKMALVAVEQGQPQAEDVVRRAAAELDRPTLTLDPTERILRATLALALGDVATARAQYEQALAALPPDSPLARDVRARLEKLADAERVPVPAEGPRPPR